MPPNRVSSEPFIADAYVEEDSKGGHLDVDDVYFAPLRCYKNPNPKPLPKNVKLVDIIRTMPPEVFEKSYAKAFRTLMVTVIAFAVSLGLLAISPWYLLPIAWAFAGTAWTGLFVIGHDCAHKNFTKSRVVNDVVGTAVMLPLIYPYEPWRVKHNFHHNNTNKLDVDNAWQPFRPEFFDNSPFAAKLGFRAAKGPFWFAASTAHWVVEHFNVFGFKRRELVPCLVSIGLVLATMFYGWPALVQNFGWWGFVKFWLMPWLGFHFWLSTFTLVHHTLPQVPFEPEGVWDDARARLTFTIHCDYPRWIEFLCHDINVHVPHHVSTQIPSYNLRPAWLALKNSWGQYLHECVFGWDLVKDITTKCQIYDEKENYISFGEHCSRHATTLHKAM